MLAAWALEGSEVVPSDGGKERRKHQQTHRYMTVSHQMKRVEPVVTGSYLRAESQKAALAAAPAGQTLATDAAVLNPAAEPVES